MITPGTSASQSRKVVGICCRLPWIAVLPPSAAITAPVMYPALGEVEGDDLGDLLRLRGAGEQRGTAECRDPAGRRAVGAGGTGGDGIHPYASGAWSGRRFAGQHGSGRVGRTA